MDKLRSEIAADSEEVTHMMSQNQGDILLSYLHDLYQRQAFCDVTLVVEGGQQVHAHAVVLASFSTYLHDILPSTFPTGRREDISIPGTDRTAFDYL